MPLTEDSLLPDLEAALFGSQSVEPDRHKQNDLAKRSRIEQTSVENDDEDSFHLNYIDSLRDKEVLDDMYERQRRDNIDLNARRRIAALTEEDIHIEVQNIWRIQHLE